MILFLYLIKISFKEPPISAKILKKLVGSTFSILFWALTAALPAYRMPANHTCAWVPYVERGINIRDLRSDTAYVCNFVIIYTELHLSGCFHWLSLSITAPKWVSYLKFPGRSYVQRSSCVHHPKQKNILRCCCRCCYARLCSHPDPGNCQTNFSELRTESRSVFEI